MQMTRSVATCGGRGTGLMRSRNGDPGSVTPVVGRIVSFRFLQSYTKLLTPPFRPDPDESAGHNRSGLIKFDPRVRLKPVSDSQRLSRR